MDEFITADETEIKADSTEWSADGLSGASPPPDDSRVFNLFIW